MDSVPKTERGYPPPCLPDNCREDTFRAEDFTAVDRKAKEAPATLVNNTYKELLEYLIKDDSSDLDKVRSLFVWLSAQPVINAKFPKVMKQDIPKAWLKRIKFDRMFYTDFFALLCRKAGVPCVIIEGSSKGAGFEVGQKGPLKNTNRWNAVYLEKSWHLINVPWALITTEGLAEGEYDLVEKDGDAVRETEVASKEVHQDLDEFWFLTDPEDFIVFCRAENPEWQLLQNPWTEDDFLNSPRYAEDLFNSDWELLSASTGVLRADEGKCQIAFSHPYGRSASLRYNLYFNTKLSPKPLPDDLQLEQRYVMVSSMPGRKALVTRLPQDGVYRIEVAGIVDGVTTGLGEFRIDCVNVRSRPAPFPEGCRQVGPNEASKEAGLTNPSQKEGIIPATEGERKEFKFHLDGTKPCSRHITAILTNNERTSEELSQYVQVEQTKEDVNVSVQVPSDINNSEIGVHICAHVTAPPDSDNQSQEISNDKLVNVNYMMTTDKKMGFPDEKKPIQDRDDLLTAIKNEDVTKFFVSLRAIEKLDPEIQNKVDVFQAQINKKKDIYLRTLVKTMQKPDVNELEQALEVYENFGGAESESIQQGRATVNLLRTMEEDNNMPQLEETLQYAHSVKLKRSNNKNVEKAEDVLVEYHERDNAEAYYKRTLAALQEAFRRVDKSCVSVLVKQKSMFGKLEELVTHLELIKTVTDKIAKLSTKDLTKISGAKGTEPHPHVKSVLMATFILLGEKEHDLWAWKFVQKLLERRGKESVARDMASIDVDKLTVQQVHLAEYHTSSCQLEVVKTENAGAALFLEWVQRIVKEKKGRDEVKRHSTESRKSAA